MKSELSISSNTVTTHLRNKEQIQVGVGKNKEVPTSTPTPIRNLTKFTNPLPQGVFPCLQFSCPANPYEFLSFCLPSTHHLISRPLLVIATTPIDNSVFLSLSRPFPFLFLDSAKRANSTKHSSIS